jgi:uncharacterized membrane protein YkvA (DUF1232 family)
MKPSIARKARRWGRLLEAVREAQLFQKAKRLASRLPFVRHVLAMWFAMLDPTVPLRPKARFLFAIAYFVIPFDIVPDFFVGIGYIDDAAVVSATVRALTAFIGDDHYRLADARLAEWQKPRLRLGERVTT